MENDSVRVGVGLDLRPLYDLAAMYRLVHYAEVISMREELLGDSSRRRVWEMADGATTQAAMAQEIGITPQAVSQHTKHLTQRGLIRKLDNGRYQRCLED